jgi:hypothetical protein
MVHKQILHELYEELEFLKHDGNPADHQAYDQIERAIFPIVVAARQRVLAAGKQIPSSLQTAIIATDKRLVEKQEEMRIAAAEKQGQQPTQMPQPRRGLLANYPRVPPARINRPPIPQRPIQNINAVTPEPTYRHPTASVNPVANFRKNRRYPY